MCRQREDVFIISPVEPGGVKICLEKLDDLLYGSFLDGFLQKSLHSKTSCVVNK